MSNRAALILLSLFFAAQPSEGLAATYYAAPLSTSCNPSRPGSGTLADPWTNPYYALTRGGLQPGDTLQLRGGTYRNVYRGFMRDRSPEDRSNACDDDQRNDGRYDGTHTVLPLFLAGTSDQQIVIENFPGETVIIDGTNARVAEAKWSQCATGTYVTTDFNTGSTRTIQIWADPASAEEPGTRLRPNRSGSCNLNPGEFTMDAGPRIFVRLPDDSNPATHSIHMTCQGGDCAAHPIHAEGSAQYLTVRRNPSGGNFYVKYGYYNAYLTGGAHHITFDGIRFVAGGGRDYGYCFRTDNANFITLRNGLCRETMGEGIGLYGGGPDTGIQVSNNVVENMDVYDTGRGWVDGGGSGSSLGMGIILKNCRDCVVRGNRVRASYRSGIQVNHSTAGCPSATCDSSNALIENNEVWDFCRFRLDSNPNSGQTDCGAILLRANGTNGVINGGIIRNNMVRGDYDVAIGGAAPSGIYIDGNIPNIQIVNNSLNDIPGACINIEPTPHPVTVIGNAMNACATASGGCNGQPCNLYLDSSVGHVTRYNTYWAPSGSDQVVRRSNGAGYTRDQVMATFESTAIQANPQFVSPTNLHLQTSSALIDAQPCADAPAADANRQARPLGAACDVGADEAR